MSWRVHIGKERVILTAVLSLIVIAGCKACWDLLYSEQPHVKANESELEGNNVLVLTSMDVAHPDGEINGQGYVDLGLSVKWAICNVGASSPSECGNYYAWSETETKSTYTDENCATFGKIVVGIEGNPQYDAATANWGGSWRMPTTYELNELFDECEFKWMTVDGNNGYEVTGPNGNSIFLPAAGVRYYSELVDDRVHGFYWSSTPEWGRDTSARGRDFEDDGGMWQYWTKRYYGLSVRAVSESVKDGPAKGSINGHEYVDLGLSVLWATCNVGASSPSDYGSHYAWGETKPKEEYTEENSKTYGKSMGSIAGDPARDVARKNWGGSWRMPTGLEMLELYNECECEWATFRGHCGLKITGPNGKSIFLPATGIRYKDSLEFAGEHGFYWSATPYEDGNTNAAIALTLSSEGLGGGVYFKQSCGMAIRPVSE